MPTLAPEERSRLTVHPSVRAAHLEATAEELLQQAEQLWAQVEANTGGHAATQKKIEELVALKNELDAVAAEYEALLLESPEAVKPTVTLDAEVKEARRAAYTQDTNQVDEIHSSDSEQELEVEPEIFRVTRRLGLSAEAFGAYNEQRSEFTLPKYDKSAEHEAKLRAALAACPLFKGLDRPLLDDLVDAMRIQKIEPNSCILRQGTFGHSGYVILEGVAEVYNEPNDHDRTFVRKMAPGRFFGETAMMWYCKRGRSVYANASEPLTLAELGQDFFHQILFRRQMNVRGSREACLRTVKMLETLNDEQIAQIVDICYEEMYVEGQAIVEQGDVGHDFFILLSGECVASVTTGVGKTRDIQEVKRYGAGDMFGELALLKNVVRKATITAIRNSRVLCLSKHKFERLFGPLSQVNKLNYLNDPRKSIADFYQPGNRTGPKGACGNVSQPNPDECTTWFAVYRPTSRDAIAKMLNGVAVGKGLNVKGKSSKKNFLSGFVPFLQINDNEHKSKIEESPADARVKVFFSSAMLREMALKSLQPLLDQLFRLVSKDRKIHLIDRYDGLYGLDLPEPVLREAYIMKPDITFILGWETGRQSEPAFMDMNLHAVRGSSIPEVVLYQIDQEDPMNPHGLLIAYAEATVKPVVSDFDTFTVGSRGPVQYSKLAEDQAELATWSLSQTRRVLETPKSLGWNSRWLDILHEANEEGFHPELPKYGFGDDTSYRLIGAIVDATVSTGAVRHGAECFNFYFPQELDENYLVVWEGFTEEKGMPWDYKDEADLRKFLLDRVADGFCFPLNPVWPVRDKGWYEVFSALQASEHAKTALAAWYPSESGIREHMESLHKEFPAGFEKIQSNKNRTTLKAQDCDAIEQVDLIFHRVQKSKWHGMRKKMRFATTLAQKNPQVSLARSKTAEPRAAGLVRRMTSEM